MGRPTKTIQNKKNLCKCPKRSFVNRKSSIVPKRSSNSWKCFCKRNHCTSIIRTIVWDMCIQCRKPSVSHECIGTFLKLHGQYARKYD